MASEWQIVGPAPQQQSSSEWELVSDSAPQTQQQSSTGMGRNLADWLVSAANSGLLGFGDEAAAGVRSVLPGFGSYEQELGAIRGGMKDYAEQHPIADTSAKVLGALALPGGLAKQGTTAGAKIAKAAAEGAGYGAAYGFGEGEGSATNRLKNAASGGLFGAGVGGAFQAAGSGIKALTPKISKASKAMNRKSLGLSYGDYKKSVGELVDLDIPDGELQTYTAKAVDQLLDDGVFGTTRDPQKLLKITRTQQKELGDQLGQVLSFYENRGVKVEPKFESAFEFLQSGGATADRVDEFIKRLGKLESEIAREGKGSLKFLQQQKNALSKSYTNNDSVKDEFTRRIYGDIQRAIEEVAPEVKPINEQLRKFRAVESAFERGLAKAENAGWEKQLINSIKTTGGFGSMLAGGVAAGAGLPATAAATGAGYLAFNPKGQQLSSGLLGLAAKASNSSPRLAPAATRGLLALGGAPESRQVAPEHQGELEAQGRGYSPRQPIVDKVHQRSGSSSQTEPLIESVGYRGGSVYKSPQQSQIEQANSSSNPPKINSNTMSILLDAVKQVESGGNAKAVSPAGAKGAYQFTDATAQDYGLKDPFNESEARKAAQSKILADLEYFGGDLELALAAYNAGRGRISGLLRKVNGKTIDDIAHLLPRETIQYLPKIEKEFRRLMGNGTA